MRERYRRFLVLLRRREREVERPVSGSLLCVLRSVSSGILFNNAYMCCQRRAPSVFRLCCVLFFRGRAWVCACFTSPQPHLAYRSCVSCARLFFTAVSPPLPSLQRGLPAEVGRSTTSSALVKMWHPHPSRRRDYGDVGVRRDATT